MFTGIVESTARISSLTPVETGARLAIHLPRISDELELGESVAINGCCLTVAGFGPDGGVEFDLLEETLKRTNLGDLEPGSFVNIERALQMGDRLSGHLVQGHVDCCASVVDLRPSGQDHILSIELPEAFARYTIFKGSIAIDGMSLTIAELTPADFSIWITPHTFAVTNLAQRKAGDRVNLEFDMIAKYLARFQEFSPETKDT